MPDTVERALGARATKPLRLWPGVVGIVLLWLARFGVKIVIPGIQGFALGVQAALVCAAAIVLWWVFFSRAVWVERLGAIALMAAGLGAAWVLRHESMGPAWLVGWAVPNLFLAFVVWAVATRHLSDGIRRATMMAAIVLACGAWTLVRTEGITGDHTMSFGWRFTPSAEERLLASGRSASPSPPAPVSTPPPASPRSAPPSPEASPAPGVSPSRPARAPAEAPSAPPQRLAHAERAAGQAESDAEWPGFRGPRRDGVVPGARLETDWSSSPPVELWRRAVGPGWSSFAVKGDLVYTQEQRGDEEVVAAYRLSNGDPVWRHADSARFFEANGGVGPRATPTLDHGCVYAFGATGILNALDAADGTLLWTRNVASDTAHKVPYWGFSSSPLVVGDVVIVAAAGQLAAYDRATGEPRWKGTAGRQGYSSPHLATIAGVPQVVMVSHTATTSVSPADGTVLWEHAWPGVPIVQPALTPEGDLLIAASGDSGTRRLAVDHANTGWKVEERWTSLGLKPYFNDFVVHEGHVYGFDARILACIALADGERKWKGGRYGNGQLLLLTAQDLLLVLSEEGELALVAATPERFSELARFPALHGKTWNHPVLVRDVLLVRNGEEMAAFRLAPPRGGG
jgi:outer membrane protein assembly factor BamB